MQSKTNYEIKIFFEEPFKCHRAKHFTNYSNILDSLSLPTQTTEKKKHFCKTEPSDKEIVGVFKYMPNNKTSMRNIQSFTRHFWNELEYCFLESFYQIKTYHEFSISNDKVIRVLEKRSKDKRFRKNWFSPSNTQLCSKIPIFKIDRLVKEDYI